MVHAAVVQQSLQFRHGEGTVVVPVAARAGATSRVVGRAPPPAAEGVAHHTAEETARRIRRGTAVVGAEEEVFVAISSVVKQQPLGFGPPGGERRPASSDVRRVDVPGGKTVAGMCEEREGQVDAG